MTASITQATDARLQFATLAALQAHPDTDLKDGDTARMLGSSTLGDQAGNLYYWDEESTTSPDNTTVIRPDAYDPSDPGRWLIANAFKASGSGSVARPANDKLRESGKTPEDFGAVGDGATDDTVAFTRIAATGVSLVKLPAGKSYRVTSQVEFDSKVRIEGPGTIVCDWDELGNDTSAILLSADDSEIAGVNFQPYEVLDTPPADDTAYDTLFGVSAAVFVTANRCRIEGCVFDHQPKGVYASGTNQTTEVTGCRGVGYLDGLSVNTADWTMIHIYDGEGCRISGNYGKGWTDMIQFSLSANRCVVAGNAASLCGQHLLYISSGENNVVTDNNGYGDFCAIKVRGNRWTISGNHLRGSGITATNRQADDALEVPPTVPATLQAHFGGAISGNTVYMGGGVESGVTVAERTSFPCVLRNVAIAGNSISGISSSDGPLRGINVTASGYDGISITGNAVKYAEGDGILLSPVTTPTNGRNFAITGNTVLYSGDNGIQVSGDYGVVSSNLVQDANASGSGDGLIYLNNVNWTVIDGNMVADSNAGTGVGIRERNTSNNNLISSNLLEAVGTGIVKVGAATVVRDNSGEYKDHAWGLASVSNGDTIAHGLSGTPSMVNVTASVPDRIVTASRDGTNITIGLTQADGSTAIAVDENVYWEARL